MSSENLLNIENIEEWLHGYNNNNKYNIIINITSMIYFNIINFFEI